uniref:N/A n=1 Tax=Ganoderma boninense TaxID=34458 RepID=A0A5K1JSD3_9APHY|nr:N/A [Ganoderma boninense]
MNSVSCHLHRLEIGHVPSDVLLLILSFLHGQDIARCIRVSHGFAALIRSDLYLQYLIELAQSGMIDGESSALPVSERLRRLRQYSSNCCGGIFNHESLLHYSSDSHQYQHHSALKGASLMRPDDVEGSSILSKRLDPPFGSFLSLVTHGSAQAGIQSHHEVIPFYIPEDLGRRFSWWAIDDAQDLLVISETSPEGTETDAPFVGFYSFSGSKTAPRPTTHQEAVRPRLQVGIPSGVEPTAGIHIFKVWVVQEHVIWATCAIGREARSYSLELCNWRTGQIISRQDLGPQQVYVALLDDSYLLVTPQSQSKRSLYLDVYSISPSIHPLYTLQLPDDIDLSPGRAFTSSCRIVVSQTCPPTPGAHFRADPSLSMVVLTYKIWGTHGELTNHLLVPCTTILAGIHAAAAPRHADGDAIDGSEQPIVPWEDWGARRCLRLRLREDDQTLYIPYSIPFGSRIPVAVYHRIDGFTSASIYVFDINPLAARHERARARAARDRASGSDSTTAVVEDVEEALPGVVDSGCSAIPYVVYHFPIAYAPPDPMGGYPIWWVEMTVTGFALLIDRVDFDESLQSWTV